MLNRREFVQASLGVSVLPLSSVSVASTLQTSKADELKYFIFDERYRDSVETATASSLSSEVLYPTSGDLTELWYRELDLAWKKKPTPVAGMLGEDEFFILERLGWDRGLRTVYKGKHTVVNGWIEHELNGLENHVDQVANALTTVDWQRNLGFALGGLSPYLSGKYKTLKVRTPLPKEQSLELFSWMLAPIS